MFCPKCGKPVSDGAQFCASCGNPVNGGTQPNYNAYNANNGNAGNTGKAKNFFNEMQAHSNDLKGPEPVDFVKAIKLFGLYALNFKGRSSKSEFWWGYLFYCLLSIALNIIPVIGSLASLVLVVPGIALSIRRMHDIGKSGWYMLMGLIPLAGPIIVLVYMCTASQPAPNQWGPAVQYTNV